MKFFRVPLLFSKRTNKSQQMLREKAREVDDNSHFTSSQNGFRKALRGIRSGARKGLQCFKDHESREVNMVNIDSSALSESTDGANENSRNYLAVQEHLERHTVSEVSETSAEVCSEASSEYTDYITAREDSVLSRLLLGSSGESVSTLRSGVSSEEESVGVVDNCAEDFGALRPEVDLTSSSHVHPTQLKLLNLLGEGGMGVVYNAQLPHGHRDARYAGISHVAVKIVSKETRPIPAEILREEVELQREVSDHPNILTLFDEHENDTNLMIVTEKLDGGDLQTHLDRNGPMPERLALQVFEQILCGVIYMHDCNISHLDLKPENVMLTEAPSQNIPVPRVKIIDFGLAIETCSPFQIDDKWCSISCGTPAYAAPEVVLEERYAPSLADVWGCGGILLKLLTGRDPFDIMNISEYSEKRFERTEQILDAFPETVSANVQSLTMWCLTRDPDARATAALALRLCREAMTNGLSD